jgi:hypothetical protein
MVKGLQKLTPNQAGTMKLKDGSTANYGSIRIENDRFVHYTGKGLRELFPHLMPTTGTFFDHLSVTL